MTELDFETQLKALHLVFLPCLALVILMLRPGQAEKSYLRNMKWVPHLLPGKWKEREYFVAGTRKAAKFWLVISLLLYIVILVGILHHRPAF